MPIHMCMCQVISISLVPKHSDLDIVVFVHNDISCVPPLSSDESYKCMVMCLLQTGHDTFCYSVWQGHLYEAKLEHWVEI